MKTVTQQFLVVVKSPKDAGGPIRESYYLRYRESVQLASPRTLANPGTITS